MKTLLAVVNEDPAPVTSLNPLVPEDVLAILKKCLAKAPGDRYERAADLEAALLACGCASGWTEERSADWWAAHPEAQPVTGTDLDSLPIKAEEK
jgi:serine/threonine-protein kinase